MLFTELLHRPHQHNCQYVIVNCHTCDSLLTFYTHSKLQHSQTLLLLKSLGHHFLHILLKNIRTNDKHFVSALRKIAT